MGLDKPVLVYTAASNFEARSLVTMLAAVDIEAHAVEDESPATYWALGRVGQILQPNVFVDQNDLVRAAELIRDFEERRKLRQTERSSAPDILAVCEACGQSSSFAATLEGTTQDCPHCGGYVDVGDVSFEFTEEE